MQRTNIRVLLKILQLFPNKMQDFDIASSVMRSILTYPLKSLQLLFK